MVTHRRRLALLLALLMAIFIALSQWMHPSLAVQAHQPGFNLTQDNGIFLPLIVREQPPTSTPTPTPTLTPTPGPTVVTIRCDWLPDVPSGGDWFGCVEDGVYEMQRLSVSFSLAQCCSRGTLRYAFEADARLTQGEGEYSLGFDVVDIFDGGGYVRNYSQPNSIMQFNNIRVYRWP